MSLPNMNDWELLRAYAAEHSEDAFASLVAQYLDLVYHAALSQVRDPHLAEEICQAVFVILARKAGSLSPKTILAGWLFRTTRFVAAKAVRYEQRRQWRERKAAEMQSDPNTPALWDEIEPLLDAAVEQLGANERNVILLRFFQRKSLKEVGATLGTTEDGARKRVTRAVEKLRSFFARKGIVLSSAALAGALSSHTLRAAPEGLGNAITSIITSSETILPMTVLAMVNETFRELARSKARIALGTAIGVVIVAVLSPFFWRAGHMTSTGLNNGSSIQAAAPPGETSPVSLAQAGTDTSTQEAMVATHIPLRVVDAVDGHSLAGARMVVYYWGWAGTSPPRIDLAADTEGRAEVPLAGKELRLVRVWVSTERHVPKVIDWHGHEFNRQPEEYLVRLEHGLTLAGIVQDEFGEPVSGARLQTTGLGTQLSSRENISYHRDLTQVSTDADGRWLFKQAPHGHDSLTFDVFHPDFAQTSATLPLSGPDTTNAVIVLSRGVTLTGRTVNTNGEPIAGATVREDGGPEASNKTDKAGSFNFAHVNPGPFKLNAKADGYSPLTRTVLASTNAQEIRLVLTPWAGDETPRQDTAPENKTIRLAGKASDSETGRPIDRFDVLLNNREEPWGFPREGRFIGEGYNGAFDWRYSIQFLSAYSLEVKVEGYAPEVSQQFKAKDGDQFVEFKLKRDDGISGQVVFPDGTPAAGAEVFLAGKGFGPASGSTPLKKHVLFPNNSDMSLRQFTDIEGRFHFKPRLSANRVVVVHDFGCAAAATSELASGPLILQPWGRIEGTVRSGGTPAPNQYVMATQAPLGSDAPQVPYSRTEISDSEGHVVFERVPPGKIELARQTGLHGDQSGEVGLSHYTSVDLKPGETAQVVIGGGGRTVIGRIEIIGQKFLPYWTTELQSLVRMRPDLAPPEMQVSEDFAAFARASVKYQREVPKYYFGVRPDGSFIVEDVAPGTYLLEVRFTEPPEDPLDREWYLTHNSPPIVSLTRQIIVTEATDGQSNEPVDAGVFSVLIRDSQKMSE
jgi:RNA polymerase sigma factor (sigma-70 family)